MEYPEQAKEYPEYPEFSESAASVQILSKKNIRNDHNRF